MKVTRLDKMLFRFGLMASFTLTTTLLYGQSRTPEIAPSQLDPRQSAERLAAAKFRLNHARELLGKFYHTSVVAEGETIAVEDLNKFIAGWIHDKLPPIWRFRSPQIAQTVIDEARRYQFDPIFLVAVIQHESKWNPSAVGDVGELGLMQIRPTTGQGIAKRLRQSWGGKLSLYNPEVNIRLGSAYLAHLRDNFSSHGRLYLAAYNMGGHAVKRALSKKIMPKDYAAKVMHYYVSVYEDLADFTSELAEKAKQPAAALAAAPVPVPGTALAPMPASAPAHSFAPQASKTVTTGIAAIATAPQGHAPASQGSQKLPALQIYPAIEQD